MVFAGGAETAKLWDGGDAAVAGLGIGAEGESLHGGEEDGVFGGGFGSCFGGGGGDGGEEEEG